MHIDAGAGNSENTTSRRGAARYIGLTLVVVVVVVENLEIELGCHYASTAFIKPHRNQLEFSGKKMKILIRQYRQSLVHGKKYLNDLKASVTSISSIH